MTGYVADLSWKSGARAIEKLDRLRSTLAIFELLNRLRSTMAVNVLISGLTFVFLLLSLLVTYCYLNIPIFRRSFIVSWVTTSVHTNMYYQHQTYLEYQLNNFWTCNNSILMTHHTGESAEWINILCGQFGGQVPDTPRLTVLQLFLQIVFSSNHNNLIWMILGTQSAYHLPENIFFSIGLQH